MDARDGPERCTNVIGYAWSGKVCGPVVCSCVGADCGELFASMAMCDRAYDACYDQAGVHRACTRHVDCGLEPRSCCPSCIAPDADQLFAQRRDSPSLEQAGACLGDAAGGCGTCTAGHNPAIYSACVEGQCTVLDVSAHAACSVDTDCFIRSKDCCACGSTGGLDNVIGVNASFSQPDYCAPDQACDDCAGQALSSPGACDAETKTCAIVAFHIK